MIAITTETIDDFASYLFDTEPFKSLLTGTNRDGFKNIIIKLLEDLYQNIPEDVIGYLEKNASNKFLDLLYREMGISDYHIAKVPDALKVRLSYLLNQLNLNRSTQNIFKLFHEALEEFFPRMNIYLININPKDLGNNSEMIYQLEPRYITDEENILTEVSINDLSGTFLMRPEQFIDREEKFSNIYTDYKSKQRIINIFPIKTGIIYVQNPSGLGNSHFDDFIPLMQMIGATLQKTALIPWKIKTTETRQHILFEDFIKLCTYLKYKEFEFKQPLDYIKQPSQIIKIVDASSGTPTIKRVTINRNKTYYWSTEPLEILDDDSNRLMWEQANFLAQTSGLSWSKFYTPIEQKLNDMILHDPDDLVEAERLEIVYKGLKRSGLYNSRPRLNQFKTDWNTLRQKPRNVSIRKISNMDEFREELIGVEPTSVLDFELILLQYFPSELVGEARDSIFKIKKLYETNKLDTLNSENGLITLVNKYSPSSELNEFVIGKYGSFEEVVKDETQLLLDLFKWYIDNGKVALLRDYNLIKRLKFPHLIDLEYTNSYLNSQGQIDKILAELLNDENKSKFSILNSIIKIKYKKIIEQIDNLLLDTNTTEETFVVIFLNLWKIVMVEVSNDKRVQFFWNEFFMRFIMGSSFKDFFYDPIMDLFLEYWFPAETSVQNKDIESIRIKDKMSTIPLESKWAFDWSKTIFDTHLPKDQFSFTIYNKDGTVKETIDKTFSEIIQKEITVSII